MKKSKFLSLLLIGIMTSSLLIGCSNSTTPNNTKDNVKQEQSEDNKDEQDDDDDIKQPSSQNLSLAANISGFKSGNTTLDYTYTDSQYGVAEDYVFEFDASDEAGYVHYDAFKVYVSEETMQKDINDMKSKGYHTEGYFCDTDYENGKIYVSPRGTVKLNENGSYNQDTGTPTWGVYNRLFLAQWIDLETGEALDEPIVTIFSVDHSLDAPVVNQTLDEENNYMLTWNAIPGATKYSVYEMISDVAFIYEGTTTDTKMICKDFEDEKVNLSMLDTITMQDTGAVFGMNYMIARCYDNGYKFVVVAENDSKMSGLSNFVNVADIAGAVPTNTISGTPVFNAHTALDAPLYGEVQMADGSTKQMLLNYHDGRMYQQEDGSIYVSIRYYNTNMAYTFKVTGMEYEDFRDGASDITARQDEATISNGTANPENNVSQVPTSNEEEKADEVEEKLDEINIEIEPSTPSTGDVDETNPDDDDNTPSSGIGNTNPYEDKPEVTDPDEDKPEITEPDEDKPEETNPSGPSTVETPNGYTTNDLYNATLAKISEVYNEYGIDVNDLSQVLYANNELEAYLAYAITARLEVITVPKEIYPEATDINKLAKTFMQVYRQNPTSGVLADLQYSYDYEALLVYYADDTDTRLNKTVEELNKAKEIANSISGSNDMEKVYAFNKYFCESASYDVDSTSTNVDMNNLSQKFIDAHTPYGILCNNYGVCESYSEAFALAGRFAGLDVIMETGYLNGGGHEWNKVQIDGKWYVVDITNNDMDVASNSLLLTSMNQVPVLSADNTAYTFNADANDISKEYYTNTDRLVTNSSDAIRLIESQLDEYGVANVRFDYNISEEDALEILYSVYEDGYNLGQYAVFNGVIGVALQ